VGDERPGSRSLPYAAFALAFSVYPSYQITRPRTIVGRYTFAVRQ
jgi:hypothetical protein